MWQQPSRLRRCGSAHRRPAWVDERRRCLSSQTRDTYAGSWGLVLGEHAQNSAVILALHALTSHQEAVIGKPIGVQGPYVLYNSGPQGIKMEVVGEFEQARIFLAKEDLQRF